MSTYGSWLKRFLLTEDGPTAVEYAVMLLLIFLVCIGGIELFGSATNASITSSSQSIHQAVSTASAGS